MDFGRDTPRLCPIRWYFCREGAETFGGYCFGSTNWDKVKRTFYGKGEQIQSSFAYDKGEPPPGATGQADPCGEDEWFALGAPASAPGLPHGAGGLPACCGAASGVAVGGYSYPAVGYYYRGGVEPGGVAYLQVGYPSSGGLRAGATPADSYLRAGRGGASLGARSGVPGTVGLRAGLVSRVVVPYPGTVGLKASPVAAVTVPVAGLVGLAVGLVGALEEPTSGTVGVNPGLVSSVVVPPSKLTVTGTIGVKVSPTGQQFTGYQTPCCGNVIPATLAGNTGGDVGQYVYSSGILGWGYNDNLTGYAFQLKCVQTSPGVYQWQIRSTPSTKCTISQTNTVVTCYPFHFTADLSQTGTLCSSPGSWHIDIHA